MQLALDDAPGATAPLVGTRPLTVIMIHDFAAVRGGAERVALTEAAGLARRGHRVTFVAGNGEPDAELAEAGVNVRITGQGTTLTDPNRARAAARGIWNHASAAVVRELARNVDPASTIVHVHGFTKVLSASVVRAAARSGLTTVSTLHDYFAACPNGGFFNYRTDQVCPLTPLSPRCVATNCDARGYSHKLWRVGRSAVQRGVGGMPGNLREFIAPSRFAAEILKPFLPSSARVHIVPNPVPAPRLPPANVGGNDAFAFVGRLEHDKGPVIFARAARLAGVPAVFVGAGDEAETVRRVYPDAVLTGWLEREQVRSTVRASRAVVSASLWYEVQPLFALEAAAHGVPAVVSDLNAAREAVADGVSGLWFRNGDVDDLAEKLAALHRNPELAERLGSAAYDKFWSEPWDTSTHLQRLEDVYRAALTP